jgi:dTDP-3-amino-3,4,6-trideoxy-alpha-D-glucose transaminase
MCLAIVSIHTILSEGAGQMSVSEAASYVMSEQVMISQSAPGLRVERHREAIDAAVARVLASDRFILGREVEAFEQEFSRFLGASFVIGVNSGTDALSLALLALGIGPGAEVIVPALTAVGTAVAVQRIGGIVRFVDIEPVTRGIDPALLAGAISSRTAAIIVVHLHGIPASLPEICRIASAHGLAIIEDCAHAHGATIDGRNVGILADAAAFSFYPTKNLGALGDGGAVVVHKPSHAEHVRRLRHYGLDGSGLCIHDGMNSRLDEFQAAVLRALLPNLLADNERRRMHARRYDKALAPLEVQGRVKLPKPRPGAVYHQYAIEVTNRDRVRAALKARGIGTGIHYSPGLHRHPRLAGNPPVDCAVTDRLAETLLSLPIQPELMEHQSRIIAALTDTLSQDPEFQPMP